MSEFINAFPLPGTKIGDIDTDWQELSARTHRQSAFTENPIELWYYRDGGWTLFPVQPLTGPGEGLQLTQVYKQPYTLGFTLPDNAGDFAPENLNSAYNYNTSGVYDPLLDEARKIVCRVGTKCYTNIARHITPTTTCSDVTGSLGLLTDLVLGNITSGSSQFVQFKSAPYSISIDLGSVQKVRHTVIRFASKVGVGTLSLGTCALPASVTVSLSSDNSTWTDFPTRHVGDDGRAVIDPAEALAFTCGDWADSTTGETIEVAFCDLNRSARYVKYSVTVPNEPLIILGGDTSWHTHFIDEIAVYGGEIADILGANVFTGYMGDQLDFTPDGNIQCVAVDPLKKLADNNDVFLTSAYRMTSAGAVELGDIVHSLLTSSAYWKGLSAYDSAFTNDEIAWVSGGHLTGLEYPLWQGQNNSMLGYCQELFNTIGWNFYADGNGVVQATEPPYTQRLPDRVCIAAEDGNYDVSQCVRHRNGKQLRNKVIVQTGKGASSGSGTITDYNYNSIARFGTRTTRITDPLAVTTQMRQKVASHFLRDYAWNLQTLSNVIRPQFETKLKQIFGFRAPARPNLFSLSTDPTTGPVWLLGKQRKRELWSLVSLQHTITYGQWTAQADWIPYELAGPIAPTVDSLLQVGGHTDELQIVYERFNSLDQPLITSFNVYLSSTSEFAGFTKVVSGINPTGLTSATQILTGLTPGQQYWVYMTSVDLDGVESLPSVILFAIAGAASGQAVTCYTIDDFTVGSTLTEGPDGSGYYTYEFLALWTAPECGFTQSFIGASLGSVPADPDNIHSWKIHDDSWDWWGPDRIASGLTWDNVTPGQLDFTLRFRSASNLSGQTLYFRIWNSARTRAWVPVAGNYTSCVVM